MCTVTVIPLPDAGPDAYRLVENRDELRSRPAALPPAVHALAGGRGLALWPTDAGAGGTWIAARCDGLCAALLNLNLARPPTPPDPGSAISRGSVVPALLRSAPSAVSPGAALASVEALTDLPRVMPFRLLATDGRSNAVGRWDGEGYRVEESAMAPLCLASSGLGDDAVSDRLPLFEELVVSTGATRWAQDRFHAHRWPDRPDVSVQMSRRDARTVSVAVVERSAAGVSMWYRDDEGAHPAAALPSSLALARRADV